MQHLNIGQHVASSVAIPSHIGQHVAMSAIIYVEVNVLKCYFATVWLV